MTSRAISPSRCHPFDRKRNSLLRSHAFSLLGGNAFHMLREFVRSAYSSLPLSRTPNSVCSSDSHHGEAIFPQILSEELIR
ncbi:hypothetical protein AAC387_Pa05g3861 [Persea americana]